MPKISIKCSGNFDILKYPFGMELEGRTYSSSGYKYSFNGKEDIKEVYGWQDYGERIYNKSICRFFSADPIIVYGQQYPELSPYQFAGNTPIQAIDLDGLEPLKIGRAGDVKAAPLLWKFNDDTYYTWEWENLHWNRTIVTTPDLEYNKYNLTDNNSSGRWFSWIRESKPNSINANSTALQKAAVNYLLYAAGSVMLAGEVGIANVWRAIKFENSFVKHPMSKNWESVDFKGAVDRFTPNAIIKPGKSPRKVEYIDNNSGYSISYDTKFQYFRIKDIKAKQYVNLKGEKIKTSDPNYQQLTHFKNYKE